jgi:hypothetical protein
MDDRANDRTKESRGEEIKDLRSGDANRIMTEQPVEGAGPDADDRPAIGGGERSEASPGGLIDTGAAGDDLPQNESTATGSPSGVPSGGVHDGSRAGSGDNDSGLLVGPDSPAAQTAALRADGHGHGDDFADRLGGGEGRGTGASGAGAATGDASAGRSAEAEGEPDEAGAAASLPDSAEPSAPDAGSPGGMGGVRSRPGASGRPPGGSSPGR